MPGGASPGVTQTSSSRRSVSTTSASPSSSTTSTKPFGAALPAVLDLTRSLGSLGKPLHFHLHDGHPLVDGLQDHISFLERYPIPFEHHGRLSLEPLYGPAGLSRVVAAVASSAAGQSSALTLEIHEHEGRLPLGDAAPLFGHWRDLTNAERMNQWLAVLADNSAIATMPVRSSG